MSELWFFFFFFRPGLYYGLEAVVSVGLCCFFLFLFLIIWDQSYTQKNTNPANCLNYSCWKPLLFLNWDTFKNRSGKPFAWLILNSQPFLILFRLLIQNRDQTYSSVSNLPFIYQEQYWYELLDVTSISAKILVLYINIVWSQFL